MARFLGSVVFGGMIALCLMGWLSLGQPQAQVQPWQLSEVPPLGRKAWVLGAVEAGQFRTLYPESLAQTRLRFSTVASSAVRDPQSASLDLAPYEGGVIMIEGEFGAIWVYDAKVIDQASPIMLVLFRELFAGTRVRQLR